MTGVLIEKGNLDIEIHTGRIPCKEEGRHRGDASTSKDHQRLSENHQKLGERHGIYSSSQPSEGTDPTNTLNF